MLGESRSQSVQRFLSLEHSLNSKNWFVEFDVVMQEYFNMQRAEAVPPEHLDKPASKVYYLPMQSLMPQQNHHLVYH